MMPAQSEVQIFRGGHVQVAGIEFLEHFVQEQEDVDEHRDLHDAAQRQQTAIRDHQPFRHPRMDDLAHLRVSHQFPQRVGRQAQHPRRFLGDGRGCARRPVQGGHLAELFAWTDRPDDPETSAFLALDHDPSFENEAGKVLLRSLAQERFARCHLDDLRAGQAFLAKIRRNRSEFGQVSGQQVQVFERGGPGLFWLIRGARQTSRFRSPAGDAADDLQRQNDQRGTRREGRSDEPGTDNR